MSKADETALKRLERQIKRKREAGDAVPVELQLDVQYALARLLDDAKEKAVCYDRISKLQQKLEGDRAGLTMADVPDEVLDKIADWEDLVSKPYPIRAR